MVRSVLLLTGIAYVAIFWVILRLLKVPMGIST